MARQIDQLHLHKYLFLVLGVIAALNLSSNFISEEFSILVTSLAYVPVTFGLVIVSLWMNTKFKISGMHGKAWILFTLFAILWLSADMSWMLNELVYEVDPYPSIADVFWIIGYPFLFAFMVLYLYPIKKGISKKIIAFSIVMASVIFVPTIYVTMESEAESEFLDLAVAASYPIGDAIVFAPALIGVMLFFKGEVNFLWTLICLGIIATTIADFGFLMSQTDDSYYSGHPLEILFLWAYTLFAFGVYNHARIFKYPSIKDDGFSSASDIR